MRSLILALLLLSTGCLRSAVRESNDDVAPVDSKTELQQLEDRLGV